MSSDAGTVDVETLAKLLLCTRQWVGKLVRAGAIPKSARGRYPLVPAVQGYIKHLKDPDRQRPEAEASNRKTDARTREIELRIAEQEARLIDINEHDEIVAALIEMTEAAARSFPGRLGNDPVVRERAQGAVDDMLADLRRHAEKRGRELRRTGKAQTFSDEAF